MTILVLNCGGSTLKYKLFAMPAETVMAKGLIDRLGTEAATLRHQRPGQPDATARCPVPDHLTGMKLVFEALTHPQHGALKSLDEISAVGHKLAHGGERITGAVRVDDAVIAAMEEMAPLVPLHNPPNLTGIRAVRELLPQVPQCGTFETSFHQTVPQHAWIYGVPYEWYERFRVRSYGFHSASHRYVTQRVGEMLGRSPEELKIISCHLGSGTSVCAIKGGKSFDISSGLTPQSGTMMSTRPGDFDPFVVTYVQRQLGLSPPEVERALTREGGLLGISGISGDMRDLEAAAAQGNARAQLAIDAFCYHVRKYIGAFLLLMGGADALAFTGGIGENSPLIRAQICADLEFLGICLDAQANEARAEERLISTGDSRVKVTVVLTDEELVVARDAYEVLQVR